MSFSKIQNEQHKHFYFISGDTPAENVQQPEISLSYNPEEVIPLKYTANLAHENEAGIVGEEG